MRNRDKSNQLRNPHFLCDFQDSIKDFVQAESEDSSICHDMSVGLETRVC